MFGLQLDASDHLRDVVRKSGVSLFVNIERLVKIWRQQQTRPIKRVQALPGASCGDPIHTKLDGSNQ